MPSTVTFSIISWTSFPGENNDLRKDPPIELDVYLGCCSSEFLDATDTALGGADRGDTFNKSTLDC